MRGVFDAPPGLAQGTGALVLCSAECDDGDGSGPLATLPRMAHAYGKFDRWSAGSLSVAARPNALLPLPRGEFNRW